MKVIEIKGKVFECFEDTCKKVSFLKIEIDGLHGPGYYFCYDHGYELLRNLRYVLRAKNTQIQEITEPYSHNNDSIYRDSD